MGNSAGISFLKYGTTWQQFSLIPWNSHLPENMVVNFHGTHWHASVCTVPQCWHQVCASFTHGSCKRHEIDACQIFWTFQNSLYDTACTPAHFMQSSRSFTKTSRNDTIRSVPLCEQKSCKCKCCLILVPGLRCIIRQQMCRNCVLR